MAGSRRDFVAGAAATLPVLATSGCGLPVDQAEASGQFGAGHVDDITVGQIRPVGAAPLVIARDVAGLYAMSTICSHRACDIRETGEITNTVLQCGCHNSAFDANGDPMSGPAMTSLTHYQVTVDGSGNITIDADIEVSASVRTPVQ